MQQIEEELEQGEEEREEEGKKTEKRPSTQWIGHFMTEMTRLMEGQEKEDPKSKNIHIQLQEIIKYCEDIYNLTEGKSHQKCFCWIMNFD